MIKKGTLKKNYTRDDFESYEDFLNYPKVAWRTKIRREYDGIIIQSGLLHAQSKTNIFKIEELVSSKYGYLHKNPILIYDFKVAQSGNVHHRILHRRLKNNTTYEITRQSDYGLQHYFLTPYKNGGMNPQYIINNQLEK